MYNTLLLSVFDTHSCVAIVQSCKLMVQFQSVDWYVRVSLVSSPVPWLLRVLWCKKSSTCSSCLSLPLQNIIVLVKNF